MDEANKSYLQTCKAGGVREMKRVQKRKTTTSIIRYGCVT